MLSRLQGLVTGSVNLRTEVGGSGTWSREVAGEDWLDERAEDNLSTARSFVNRLPNARKWGVYPVTGSASQRTKMNLNV